MKDDFKLPAPCQTQQNILPYLLCLSRSLEFHQFKGNPVHYKHIDPTSVEFTDVTLLSDSVP